MFLTVVDAAQLLARQGSQEDAHWVLDFGREHIPDYFQKRKVECDLSDDFVRRKAHKGEITAGLADEHGYLKLRAGSTLLPGARPVFNRRG